ncbi:MAG: hypothetical protein AB7S39_10830 [Gemmatimonadales bacterium]
MKNFRLGLAVVGIIVAAAGVLRDDRRLTGAAIVLLSVSLVMRVFLAWKERAGG